MYCAASPLVPAQERTSFRRRQLTKLIVWKLWRPLVTGSYQFNSYVSSLFLSRKRVRNRCWRVILFKVSDKENVLLR